MLESQIDPDEYWDNPDCELTEDEIEELKANAEIDRQMDKYNL